MALIKSRITELQKNKIKEMYKSGMTCKEIFRKFSNIYSCEESIQKIVRNMGISRGKYKKPVVVDENYFECIDNERKAYWVGFLLADGCIIKYKNKSDTLKLELSVKDKYIIESFAKDIKTDRKVRDYKYSKKHNAQIQIKSNKISNDLSKYGIVPNKTFKIDGIKNIPIELIRHFIRGYFDGDGCAYLYKPKDQNKHRLTITFCGTKDFLNDLNTTLSAQAFTETRTLIDMNKYGCNVFNLRYIGNNDIRNLFNYMYKDATVYLKRKREKFITFFNERN